MSSAKKRQQKLQEQKSGLSSDNVNAGVRIDKWLWAARFCKTRAIAREWIQAGKVQYNQQRTKPSKLVEVGGVVKIPLGYDEKIVTVLGVNERRQSAQIAQSLYEETLESIAQREKNQQARQLSAFHSPKPDHRPDKKQRRQIIKFKHQ